MKELIIWGATGQAIVLEEFLSPEYLVSAIFDRNREIESPFNNTPIYYGWEGFNSWRKNLPSAQIGFIVAIGGALGMDRLNIHNKLKAEGLLPISAVHPSAYIAKNANMGEGCQILPNATICAKVKMGLCTIVNTAASIDHECVLGNGVHIAPGTNIAGRVEINDYTFIGTGATVLPNIKIGSNSIIGAGSVVNKNIDDNVIAYGNPIKIIRKNK